MCCRSGTRREPDAFAKQTRPFDGTDEMKTRLLALYALLTACAVVPATSARRGTRLTEQPVTAPKPLSYMADVWSETSAVALWACPTCDRVSFVPSESVKSWAMASWAGAGVIAYSPSMMADVGASKGREAVVGVIAHEWGHIVLQNPSQILADAYAGCVLRILHYDIKPFVEFLGAVHSRDEWQELALRQYAVIAGWRRCTSPGEMRDAFGRPLSSHL